MTRVQRIAVAVEEIDEAIRLERTVLDAKAMGLNPMPSSWEFSRNKHETYARHAALMIESAKLLPELLTACKALLMLSLPTDVSGNATIQSARETLARIER